MSKDPAFLFYSSDFITGVSDLTMEERGQYITLLCLQHQKGRLSGKAVAIAVPNVTADVMAKFKKDDKGLWYNERLEIEAEKRRNHSEKQRQRALDGWDKRKKQSHDNTTADAMALPLENENVIEDVIENNNVNIYPTFSDFWDLYDKKSSDKKTSEKKWSKLTQATKEQIINHVQYYVQSTPDKQFRKNAETYLNQEHWHNEIINNGQTNKTRFDGDQLMDYIRTKYKK